MGDAPERIWIQGKTGEPLADRDGWQNLKPDVTTEYIRFDLHQAALDRAGADKAIRAIPSPAPMTAQQAAKVPEVAALMVEAHEASLSLRATGSTRQINQADKVDAALTAITEAKP